MTAPVLDLSDIPVEDVEGVPNHKATSGERGEKPRKPSGKVGGFWGRTGGADANFAANEKPRKEVPKLSPGMKKNLEDFYSGVGAMIRPFDEFAGDTIIEQAPKCADSVYKLAQSNDSVRRFVLALTTTTVTGAVLMAHLPIILAFVRHSKNETVRNTAAGTMMALKFADAAQAQNLFGTGDKPEDGE